ncbi:MAG: response regulator [Chthoniobacterales bacterium]|nr:response regulator [Chthoniobacterales bacterium]MDQ3120435.1 response regulator [Verrucomicrobiota bacterium]
MRETKPKILIVDDQKDFTRVTKLALTDYEFCEENNSSRALATARAFRPDLILLDVMMPNLDGGDIAAQLRADSTLQNIPIVFLTGIVTRQEAETGPLLGGFPFISKPVDREKLVQQIEKYLPI